MLYELAKHQDIQQKLYDQVTSVLGETGEADSESLQEIPYLGKIIKETQRYTLFSYCTIITNWTDYIKWQVLYYELYLLILNYLVTIFLLRQVKNTHIYHFTILP